MVSTYQSHVVLKDTLAGSFLTFIQALSFNGHETIQGDTTGKKGR